MLLSSWHVVNECFSPPGWLAFESHWNPTIAQSKSVTRAMRGFVRKSNQYALIGGNGRKRLYIYEPDDPLSAMWARLSVESRDFVPRNAARAALNGRE